MHSLATGVAGFIGCKTRKGRRDRGPDVPGPGHMRRCCDRRPRRARNNVPQTDADAIAAADGGKRSAAWFRDEYGV
jgi:nucleoside-diphosphate-sugar epimerase